MSDEQTDGLTEEQVKRLPYTDTPATSSDVALEMRRHAAMVAAVVHAHPTGALDLLEDATKEPGQSVLIQEVRLAIALESWLGEAQAEAVQVISQGLGDAMLTQVAQVHDKLHEE